MMHVSRGRSRGWGMMFETGHFATLWQNIALAFGLEVDFVPTNWRHGVVPEIVAEKLAADKQLRAFKHHGFWRPMDTLRDKRELESLWHAGDAPWKIW